MPRPFKLAALAVACVAGSTEVPAGSTAGALGVTVQVVRSCRVSSGDGASPTLEMRCLGGAAAQFAVDRFAGALPQKSFAIPDSTRSVAGMPGLRTVDASPSDAGAPNRSLRRERAAFQVEPAGSTGAGAIEPDAWVTVTILW